MNGCDNCEKKPACEDAVCDKKRVNCPFFKNLLNIVYEDDYSHYVVNGEAFYSVVNGEIVLQRVTDERYFYDVYDLIGGLCFLDYDQEGYWEGSLCGVLVDGYVSNIGLCSNCGLPYQEGPYYLTLGASLWEKLCSEHIVQVNWANK